MKWPNIKQLTINDVVSPSATYYKYFSWLLIVSLLIVNLSLPARALDNPERRLTEVIEDLVTAKCPDWTGLDVRVTFKYADKLFESLRGLEGDVDFKVVEAYKEFKPVGNIILPIVVSGADFNRKIFVRAKVEVFKNIVVASKSIKRGEIVGDEDVSLEERDIAMLPEKYFEDITQVIFTEARTTIPKNSTLFEWMLKEVPLVRRGDTVAILVKGPSLLVKTKGTALEDGYLDRMIKVKSENSKKTVEGTLVSSDEVEVTLK